VSFAIANSFLLNSPMDASGFYFLIHFQEVYGFSLRLSINFPFLPVLPSFSEQVIPLAYYMPLVPLPESD
jgi:hypothetical protein